MSLVANFSGGVGVSGSAIFTNETTRVRIDLNLKGLAASTTYGFHYHNNLEISNCLYCPYSCAHYTVANTTVGVLQNLVSDSLGQAQYTFYDSNIVFSTLFGNALVIHNSTSDCFLTSGGSSEGIGKVVSSGFIKKLWIPVGI
jgi:Cu/Zn superoxide dismutase